MGKGKSKKKAKQNTALNPLQSTNINLPENMNTEEMQHIIAKAIVEAEETKAQNEENRQKKALAEWHKTIGYKEHKSKFKHFCNEVKVFIKILFLHKKDIKGNIASSVLLKSFIMLFFWLMKLCSLLFAIFLIGYFPIQYFMGNISQFPWQLYLCCVPLALLTFTFSRLFRMAGIEIDNLDDRNYLFGLFASITSLVSIIIAVIAIVEGA